MRLATGAVFMGWYSLVFLCCVEGVEATLVFYNYKFQNSFPRLLRCVLRFGGFSCVCWGYSDSNCRVRDACWCLGPVGLWRCGVDGARWARKYYGGAISLNPARVCRVCIAHFFAIFEVEYAGMGHFRLD